MTGRVTEPMRRLRRAPRVRRGAGRFPAPPHFLWDDRGPFCMCWGPMRKLLVPALLSLVACASQKEAAREELPASASAAPSELTRPASLASAQEESSRMNYPATRAEPVVDTLHGAQ